MSGEPDSGSGPGSIIKQMEPPTTNNNDETECDTDRVTASSASYDSSEGNSTLRCDRCDTFETQSRTLMMAHTAQCGVSSQQQDGEQEAESQPATEANKQPRKLFECDVCNMKFSNGANMRRHKMRHTGVKPYECRVCQKRFFRKDHLAEHFTTHTKTLPYHCPICNRGFQRQIAMRAHFQNEHVGQHDLVKTCPLCSYRAGTMKSLRVHFFNRHGIDLDNPGPGAPSSLLLALDPQNAGNLLPSLAAAAAAGQSYSDSGDSLRSTDNATPPMHFLTPHVEISMADNNENFNCDPITTNTTTLSTTLEIQPCQSRPNGGSPLSPNSADSNSNAPSSSHTLLPSIVQNSRHLLHDSTITPSISLIPIKQEPISTDDYQEKLQIMTRSNEQQISLNTNTSVSNSGESSTPTSSLTSLIKVSPLKSLLREDLKRRISARASNRASRNNNNNNSNNNNLTGTNSLTITADTPTNAATIATTSNGTITSTGPETEIILSTRRRNLQCLFCGIEFPDQTLYFLHKGCHSESNPWKCNICGEQCNNVYEFNSHLLSKSHQ